MFSLSGVFLFAVCCLAVADIIKPTNSKASALKLMIPMIATLGILSCTVLPVTYYANLQFCGSLDPIAYYKESYVSDKCFIKGNYGGVHGAYTWEYGDTQDMMFDCQARTPLMTKTENVDTKVCTNSAYGGSSQCELEDGTKCVSKSAKWKPCNSLQESLWIGTGRKVGWGYLTFPVHPFSL